ncbi:hypothetical protein [Ornithinimicrobium sediminis]|uniref:hypothetical protein n=1 Tax=Ornithinimicrobium sediminis TaxID=2904603 RepID=UPI001E4DACE1|nr:hypothetical protein [Ornithinimicrobium sediminis]MCE0487008.1 hypothetical protein [Ornithinimicrobium sediminis]
MRSRLVLVLGALAALVLSAVIVVGVAFEQWVLAAAGAAALLSACLLVQLDSWRRARSLRRFLRDELRRGPAVGSTDRSTVSESDVVGAVRLMQAQYTGRLDRMQAALDRALAESAATRHAGHDER